MNTGTTGPPGMLAASSTQVPLSYLGCFCKGKGLYRYPAPDTVSACKLQAEGESQMFRYHPAERELPHPFQAHLSAQHRQPGTQVLSLHRELETTEPIKTPQRHTAQHYTPDTFEDLTLPCKICSSRESTGLKNRTKLKKFSLTV